MSYVEDSKEQETLSPFSVLQLLKISETFVAEYSVVHGTHDSVKRAYYLSKVA